MPLWDHGDATPGAKEGARRRRRAGVQVACILCTADRSMMCARLAVLHAGSVGSCPIASLAWLAYDPTSPYQATKATL